MKKSIEILNKIKEMKAYIQGLQKDGKVDEAHEKLTTLNDLKKEYTVQVELENDDIENLAQNGKKINIDDNKNPNVTANEVFNKLVFGKTVSEKEYEIYKNGLNPVFNEVGQTGQVEHVDERGGYLVPEETASEIKELKRSEVSLKNYCNVVNVSTMSGKFPVSVEDNGKLIKFEELTEIEQTHLLFAQQKWAVDDYGIIIPISRTFAKDTKINIFQYIGRHFAKRSTNTENEEILTLLKSTTEGEKVEAKSIDDIRKVLNVDLDPAISQRAKIFTNQSGFDYLDGLKDNNGREILSDSANDPTRKVYKGREIVPIPDAVLASPEEGTKLIFYVGDMEEAINFYDRLGIEIAQSEHAGFNSNAILLRVIERFDVGAVDKKAIKMVELTPTPVA